MAGKNKVLDALNVKYYYMLEGIDKKYQPDAALNEAIYNYLLAGSYTFKVKTKNTEGQ